MGKLRIGVGEYFRGILHAVFLVMLRSGISKQQVMAISKVALAAATDQIQASGADNPRMSIVVASALHTWHHKRAYLTSQGKPRALSLRNGRPSIAELIRDEDGNISIADTFAAMTRLKLLRRTKGGRYCPTGRYATIAHLDPVLAEHVCHSLGRLLTTVNNNVRDEKQHSRLIERSAQVQDLPRRRLREFREFANAQGEILVSTVNDWLEARRAGLSRRSARDVARAGIHVFAFSEHIPLGRDHRATRP